MKFRKTFLGLSLFILLGASALAKDGAKVTVKLIDKAGNVVAVKTVDADGDFSFEDVPAGSYTVRLVVIPDEYDSGKGAAGSTGKMSGAGNNPMYEDKGNAFERVILHLATVSAPRDIATGQASGKQTQGATFGEKVTAGKAHYTIKVQNVREAERAIFIKMNMVQSAARAQSGWVKIETVSETRATSGLRDTMKTQVRAVPTAEIEVLEWSWGASNPGSVHREKLKATTFAEGADVKVQITERAKEYVGHVTLIK